MDLKRKYVNIETGKLLPESQITEMQQEYPDILVTEYEKTYLCECGSDLYVAENRTNRDKTEIYHKCRDCGNEYREYSLHYPDENTRLRYSREGVFERL